MSGVPSALAWGRQGVPGAWSLCPLPIDHSADFLLLQFLASALERLRMLTRGGRGCAGLCPPGCPPLPRQSRATTSSARVLAVNEITATARPLCRRRRSGQHPVSTWIHGNVALISMAEGGWAGDASHWRARALSKAQLCAGAGQSRGLLENRLLSSLPTRIWVKRSLFQGQPARAGPWLTLTRAGTSLLQTSNTSHPLGEMRLELRVCGPCLAPWCWEGAESPPRSQTPPRRGWELWQPRVPAGERQGVP